MSANQEMWRLWETSIRMAMEMPWVMGQRLWMFSQPWDAKTMAEYQLMFSEKAEGFGEAWQAWMYIVPVNNWMVHQPVTTQQCEHMMKHSLRTINQTLKPLSKRVHANHCRLKS